MNMRWKFSILVTVFILVTVNPAIIFAQPARTGSAIVVCNSPVEVIESLLIKFKFS